MKIKILLLSAFLIFGITSCTSKKDIVKGNELKIAGSSSVTPVVKSLKEAFVEKNKDYTIQIQDTGSTAGITATIENASDIGMSSRDLKKDELEKGLVPFEIALDGIAVIINKENLVSDLTREQVKQIFEGKIKNWSEIGGAEGEIILISREEGSGTRGAFEELLKLEESVARDGNNYKKSTISNDALFENSTGAVKTNVINSKNSIGYISLGSVDDSIKALMIDGYEITEKNIKEKKYPISRSFILCTFENPSLSEKSFIDFILSKEGQQIVSDNKYISIN